MNNVNGPDKKSRVVQGSLELVMFRTKQARSTRFNQLSHYLFQLDHFCLKNKYDFDAKTNWSSSALEKQ